MRARARDVQLVSREVEGMEKGWVIWCLHGGIPVDLLPSLPNQCRDEIKDPYWRAVQ